MNDGDGLILGMDASQEVPLASVEYTRLAHIDAPELFSVHYMRDFSGTVYHKYTGHHSMLVLKYFLRRFVSEGHGQLLAEIPKDGQDDQKDHYGRTIKEYWIRWHTKPSDEALKVIGNHASMVSDTEGLLGRVMSLSDAGNASIEHPFLINLNALLILSGASHVFGKFCQDQRLFQLQAIAKENKVGPIWSGASRNLLAGHNVLQNHDELFSVFNAADIQSFYSTGFLTIHRHGVDFSIFLPWQERSTKRKLQSARPAEIMANDRKATASISPYGFSIALERYFK